MNRLPVIDDCQSAAEVFARAKAVLDRRLELSRVLPPKPPLLQLSAESPPRSLSPAPPRQFMWPIAMEVAAQIGINPQILKDDAENGRKLPFVQYRQLAIALALHLTGKTLNQVGKAFNVEHTTVVHAERRMAAIIDAVGLTKIDAPKKWVAATLPLLFAYIEQLRFAQRERAIKGGLPMRHRKRKPAEAA